MTFASDMTTRLLTPIKGVFVMLGVVGLLIVTALHLPQPGHEASYQLMSELALGPHEWATFLAFAIFALSAAGIQSAGWNRRGEQNAALALQPGTRVLPGLGILQLGRSPEVHKLAIPRAFVFSILGITFLSSAGYRSSNCPKWFAGRGEQGLQLQSHYSSTRSYRWEPRKGKRLPAFCYGLVLSLGEQLG